MKYFCIHFPFNHSCSFPFSSFGETKTNDTSHHHLETFSKQTNTLHINHNYTNLFQSIHSHPPLTNSSSFFIHSQSTLKILSTQHFSIKHQQNFSLSLHSSSQQHTNSSYQSPIFLSILFLLHFSHLPSLSLPTSHFFSTNRLHFHLTSPHPQLSFFHSNQFHHLQFFFLHSTSHLSFFLSFSLISFHSTSSFSSFEPQIFIPSSFTFPTETNFAFFSTTFTQQPFLFHLCPTSQYILNNFSLTITSTLTFIYFFNFFTLLIQTIPITLFSSHQSTLNINKFTPITFKIIRRLPSPIYSCFSHSFPFFLTDTHHSRPRQQSDHR